MIFLGPTLLELLEETSTNWWEKAWVWTAIGTVAAIIIGIIKLILIHRNNKKPGRGNRKRR